jgi:hypothetical protein
MMGAMGSVGSDRSNLAGAALLGALFVATAVVAAVAPNDSPLRAVQPSGEDSWPGCGSVRGRATGCFTTAATPAVVPTTSTTLAARPCRVADLRVTGGPSQGAGGTRYTGLGFLNRSSSACSLAGHAIISFVDRSGRVLGQARPTPGPETVSVAAGQYATAALGVAAITLGDCRSITPATLRIALPGGGVMSAPAGDFAFCPDGIASIGHFSGPHVD